MPAVEIILELHIGAEKVLEDVFHFLLLRRRLSCNEGRRLLKGSEWKSLHNRNNVLLEMMQMILSLSANKKIEKNYSKSKPKDYKF